MRILVIEDQKKIAAFIEHGLRENGFAVDVCHTGEDGYFNATTESYDAIVMDIMLPGRDGLSILRSLRQKGVTLPVMLLTARGELNERVEGLNAGADDYLVKPFAMKELLARMRALTRRTGDQTKSSILSYADLSLDTRTHQVRRGGHIIPLALKEFSVLECLLREPGRVLTRAQIAEHVWSYENFNQSNVVDVYVRNLRRKIDEPFEQKLIYTVRGVGYCLAVYETD